MRVLVSGGFGQIGSSLTPLLVAEGCDVGVIARRVPASFAELAKQVDLYLHDLRADRPLVLRRGYDVFIHLAGSPHSDSSGNAAAASQAATRFCLDLCRTNEIGRFVHFSTFQVYGRDWGTVDEATPLAPVNEYGKIHKLVEEQVRQASRDGILEHTILRPTNAYGRPLHPDVHRWSLVPACFCKSAVEDGEIVLRTSGLQQKDFIYLGRLASLTYAICQRFEQFRGEALNLASGTACAVIDVAREVRDAYERLTGRACAFQVLSDDPPMREPLVVSRVKTGGLPIDAAIDSDLGSEIGATLQHLTN